MHVASPRRHRFRLLGILVTIGVLVASCSSTDDTADDSGATPTAAPTTTVLPTTSTPASTTSSTTTTTAVIPTDPDAIVDTWGVRGGNVITYEADGSYGVYVDVGDEPSDTGTYTFDGVTLVMTGATESDYCPDEVGTFTVTFPDDLTADVDVVEDPCGQRRNSLTFGLTRQPSDS